MISLTLVVFAILAVATSASILDDYIGTYREILYKFEEERTGAAVSGLDRDNFVVSVESVKRLLALHDDDSRCSTACEAALIRYVSKNGLPFHTLDKVIRDIYGDEISEDPYAPQEIHLALHTESTGMNVMWVTMEELEKPIVQFMKAGQENWDTSTSVAAATSTYTVPKKWWPIFTGRIYSADMLGLEHSTQYVYRVGGYSPANTTMRYSDAFTFTAAPVIDKNRSTTVATLSDHGTFELLGFKTVDKMVNYYNSGDSNKAFDHVHVSGDLSYAGLSTAFEPLHIDKEDEFEHMWDLLGVQNQPVAARVPWMVTDGNHERFYDWAAYKARFTMPSNFVEREGYASNGNFWYTYQYGNAQWISLDSEADLDEGSPQISFLQAALEKANANRAAVPWVVVTLHKPLYCSMEGTPGGYADKLEGILNKNGVDLVFTGHMHGYERIHPVQEGTVLVQPSSLPLGEGSSPVDVYSPEGKGPVLVMQGNAGGMQGGHRWVQPQPDWSAFRCSEGACRGGAEVGVDMDSEIEYQYSDTFGFGMVTFNNATHLQYRNIPVSGTIGHDEFWIVK